MPIWVCLIHGDRMVEVRWLHYCTYKLAQSNSMVLSLLRQDVREFAGETDRLLDYSQPPALALRHLQTACVPQSPRELPDSRPYQSLVPHASAPQSSYWITRSCIHHRTHPTSFTHRDPMLLKYVQWILMKVDGVLEMLIQATTTMASWVIKMYYQRTIVAVGHPGMMNHRRRYDDQVWKARKMHAPSSGEECFFFAFSFIVIFFLG